MLINLLICDLRTTDEIHRNGDKYINIYEEFLNSKHKIWFHWTTDKASKGLKWWDLTGPEQIRLFENINIPVLFPNVPLKINCKNCGMKFIIQYRNLIPKNVIPGTLKLKSRMSNIIHLNLPEKNVTPYMHAMAYHIPEFLRLHKGILYSSHSRVLRN